MSERAGGVPLFVEEVTRLLLERGQGGGLQAIPPTLRQSLAARLDRLGEAREVAQIGAVWAVTSLIALLRAVGGIDDPVLQSTLDRLADADLLISEGAGSQASYRFKHALIQDAAYESLLKSQPPGAAPPRGGNPASDSQSPRRPSRKSSPIISPRPASTSSRSNGGERLAIGPCAARPSRRRSPISARRSRWRTRRGAPP